MTFFQIVRSDSFYSVRLYVLINVCTFNSTATKLKWINFAEKHTICNIRKKKKTFNTNKTTMQSFAMVSCDFRCKHVQLQLQPRCMLQNTFFLKKKMQFVQIVNNNCSRKKNSEYTGTQKFLKVIHFWWEFQYLIISFIKL